MGSILSTVTISNLWAQGADFWTLLSPIVLLGMGISFVAAVVALVYRYGRKIARAVRG